MEGIEGFYMVVSMILSVKVPAPTPPKRPALLRSGPSRAGPCQVRDRNLIISLINAIAESRLRLFAGPPSLPRSKDVARIEGRRAGQFESLSA